PVAVAVVLGLAAMGCAGSSTPENGLAPCKVNTECPVAYHCASDNTCWRDGSNPVDQVPNHYWISSGGGSSPVMGRTQLNLSVGGQGAMGESSANGRSLQLGHMTAGR